MSRQSYDLVNQEPDEDVQSEDGVYRQFPNEPPPSYGESVKLGQRPDVKQDEQRPILQRQPSKLSQESLPFADDDGSLASSSTRALEPGKGATGEDPVTEKRYDSMLDKLKKAAQNTRASDGSIDEVEMMIVPAEENHSSLRNRKPQRRSLEEIELKIGNDDETTLEDNCDQSRETSFAAGPSDTSMRGQRSSLIIQPSERPLRDGVSLESSENEEPRIPDCPHPLLTYLVTKWIKLSPSKRLIVAIVVICVLGLLLTALLLPPSFVYVNYYEYAISRNKWTNAEDFSRVYDSGCYLLAPQYELVRFTATAHHLVMHLGIMNKESLGIDLEIMLQYFLKRNEVVDLYRRYHLNYEQVIKNVVEATVKNTAITFTMDDFRLRRNMVETAILEQLQLALSGSCCPPCCASKCPASQSVLCGNCDSDPSTCTRGHHVELRYFQMGQVSIPEDVLNRYMRWSVLKIEWEREYFIQDKAVVEKNTTMEVQKYLNKAKEIREAAKAQSHLILAKAKAEKDKILQRSYQTALKRMFAELNVTREENKLSYIYLRALDKGKDNLLAFNYDFKSAVTP